MPSGVGRGRIDGGSRREGLSDLVQAPLGTLQALRIQASSIEVLNNLKGEQVDRLLAEISLLPVAERMLLAHAIIDNAIAAVDAAPVTAEQLAELHRRDAAIDAGKDCLSWDEAKKRLFGA